MSASPAASVRNADLAAVSVPRLLFSLLRERFTGVITLTQPAPDPGARVIVIRGGMPVFTDWVSTPDRLGALLLEDESVEADALEAAVAAASDSGRKLGEVLIDQGLVDAAVVKAALRKQCLRKLVYLFALRDGTAELVADTAHDQAQLGQINVLELIRHGVFTHYDLSRVVAEMGDTATGPVAASNALERYHAQFGFDPDDDAALTVLAAGTGPDLDTLEKLPGMDRERAGQLIYTLWACGMLRSLYESPSEVSDTRSAMEAAEEVSTEALLTEIEAKIEARAKPFEILDVATDANAVEIGAAFERLRRPLDPGRLHDETPADLRARVEAAYDVLQNCHTSLQGRRQTLARFEGDRMLREKKYDKALIAYEECTSLDPDDMTLQAALIFLRYQNSPKNDTDAKRATNALDKIVEDNPTLAQAHYHRGLILLDMGREDVALRSFNLALDHDAKLVDAERQVHAIRARKSSTKTADKGKDGKDGLPEFKPKATKHREDKHVLLRGKWPAVLIAVGVILALMLIANFMLGLDIEYY